MQTTVVESTALSKVAYDDHLRALLIEFRNGTVYQYIDVPDELYQALLSAESKSAFFNQSIRGRYAHKSLTGFLS